MRTSRITLIMFCCILAIAATSIAAEAATTFNGSTIVSFDDAQRTITFQTMEGQVWTLPVSDPNLMKQETISKGDRVGIEIDLDDRIIKITKLGEKSSAADSQVHDDLKP